MCCCWLCCWLKLSAGFIFPPRCGKRAADQRRHRHQSRHAPVRGATYQSQLSPVKWSSCWRASTHGGCGSSPRRCSCSCHWRSSLLIAKPLPGMTAVLAIAAALCHLPAGSLVERWLFFAEARHVVSLYYGGGPLPCADRPRTGFTTDSAPGHPLPLGYAPLNCPSSTIPPGESHGT